MRRGPGAAGAHRASVGPPRSCSEAAATPATSAGTGALGGDTCARQQASRQGCGVAAPLPGKAVQHHRHFESEGPGVGPGAVAAHCQELQGTRRARRPLMQSRLRASGKALGRAKAARGRFGVHVHDAAGRGPPDGARAGCTREGARLCTVTASRGAALQRRARSSSAQVGALAAGCIVDCAARGAAREKGGREEWRACGAQGLAEAAAARRFSGYGACGAG